jgi:hypothetical protein
MWALGAFSLPVIDQAAGTVTLPFWVAGGFLLVLLAVALSRGVFGRVVSSFAVVALVGVTVTTAVMLISRSDRAEERRVLDRRLAELSAREIAPGSVLACLDAGIGEAVEGSCEKAVFASPETVAAATSFANARLTLLIDGLEYANRTDPGYENALADLRRSVEADRFGFVAQVLASRDGCTAGKCDALPLLHDAGRIRANLNDRTFDAVVARNASSWPSRPRPGTPVAAAPPPPTAAPVTGITFPSAASIPAVSIMNNEPGVAAPGAAPAGAAPPPPAPAPRRPAARTAQPRTPPAQGSPANPNAAQSPSPANPNANVQPRP